MKVFVRTADLAQTGQPVPVIAYYPDTTSVADTAHGENVTVLNLPDNAVKMETRPGGRGAGRPVLVENWRSFDGAMFSITDQLASLHELLSSLLKYGGDLSKWPPEAIARKDELEAKWARTQTVKGRVQGAKAAVPMTGPVTTDTLPPINPPGTTAPIKMIYPPSEDNVITIS